MEKGDLWTRFPRFKFDYNLILGKKGKGSNLKQKFNEVFRSKQRQNKVIETIPKKY